MANLNHEGNTKNKGAAAPTTTPQAETNKSDFKDNSAHNQRSKLLGYLYEHGSITTTQARQKLDVMSPAPRIMELRKAGYSIVTVPDTWTSEHGIKHKGVARYVLVPNLVSAYNRAKLIEQRYAMIQPKLDEVAA